MRIKHQVITIFLMSLVSFLYASDSDASEILFQNEQVKIEQTHAICKSNQGYDYDYVLLKFTNLTNESIDIIYDMQVEYDNGKGKTTDGDLKYYELSLPANGSVEGTCDEYYKKQFSVFDHSLTNHPNAYKGRLVGITIGDLKLK